MAMSINTNIASLNAQRNLNKTQMDIQTAVARLSSGLRINSAKDDAAGIAVATRMTTQIGGLDVAIRNANDGISVAQTAEGAMGQMVDNLNRAHDLSVQAASYNTSADRTSLNQEVSQILDEMGRIASQTTYNGSALLSGGFSGDFQIGASVNQTINISLDNLNPTNLGVATNYTSVSGLSDSALAARIANSYSTALTAGTSKLNGVDLAAVASGVNSRDKIDAINATTQTSGVTAFGYGNALVSTSFATGGTGIAAITSGQYSINGVAIGSAAKGATDSATMANLATAINNVTGQTGVTATVVADPNNSTTNSLLVLTNRTGAAINLTNGSGDSTVFANGGSSAASGQNGAIVMNGQLNNLTAVFDGTATGAAIAGASSSASETLANATLASQSVTSSSNANLAMLVFEKALDSINSARSVIGAKLNRMQSVTVNLANTQENISAARSRILDADFAQETAKLTRAQILQQAGTAMVAQANQLPQTVLSLLK